MKPEEYLDRLIEKHENGMEPLPVINDEVTASLAAAHALTRLNEIDIPPNFARKLELSIRSRSRDLARQNNSSLSTTRSLSIPRSPRSQRPLVGRAWITALGIAAALMLTCVGILTASARSLPGDALYGLKQAEEQFTLDFTNSPQDRVNAQINQLQSTLTDLYTVVNAGRGDDAIRQALNTITNKTNNIRTAVAALPPGASRDTAQRNLNNILGEEDQTLRHLLNQVDFAGSSGFHRTIGSIGRPGSNGVTHYHPRPE